MLCFTAFTPHSPLLLESIGKKHVDQLVKTRTAMITLAQALIESQPEVLFMISAHSVLYETAFSINLHDSYATDFKEFGDHTTSRSFRPDLQLISAIQRAAREKDFLFFLKSYASLDYGSGVPLTLLCEGLQPKIVPISYSGLNRKQHLAFGQLLKEVVLQSEKRIGLIASGDLSHTLSSTAPFGFRKEGKQFDDVIKRAIEQFSASALFSLDDSLVEQAEQCALRPLLVLFGVLEKMALHPTILSYEAPFGVGYLVAKFYP